MMTLYPWYGAASLMVLLLSFFCGCSGRQQAPGAEAAHTAAADSLRQEPDTAASRFATVMQELKGEWVTTRFDRAMRATRSVFRAIDQGKGKRMLCLDVRPDSTFCEFVYSFDLYDSALRRFDSLHAAGPPGVYGLLPNSHSSDDDMVDDTVGIVAEGRVLYWRNDNNGPVVVDSFIRLQTTMERYLRAVLVEGRYRDEKGKNVAIDADGLMIWGEDTLQCKVGHYFFFGMPVDDYLDITGRHNGQETNSCYGFRWKGKNLNLYKLLDWKEGPGPDHSPHPLHVLTKL